MAFMWLLTFQLVQVKQKSRITQQGFRLAQDAEIGLEETSMTTQTGVKIGYDMRALTIIVFLFLGRLRTITFISFKSFPVTEDMDLILSSTVLSKDM